MFPVDARTALSVARVERDNFHTILHRGLYPCAPATEPRQPRLFGDDDLIALVAMGVLLRGGIGPSVAGPTACELHNLLTAAPGYSGTFVSHLGNDGAGELLSDSADPEPPTADIAIDVGAIRDYIARALPKVVSDN